MAVQEAVPEGPGTDDMDLDAPGYDLGIEADQPPPDDDYADDAGGDDDGGMDD